MKPKQTRQWKVWAAFTANGSLVHEEINPVKACVRMPNGGSIQRATLTLSKPRRKSK